MNRELQESKENRGKRSTRSRRASAVTNPDMWKEVSLQQKRVRRATSFEIYNKRAANVQGDIHICNLHVNFS